MSEGLRLVVRRTIRAPVARVFAAWTEPAHIVRWWGPPGVTCPEAEVDLRVGGQYRIANALPGGGVLWIGGEFERVDPPRGLVYTWRIGSAPGPAERVTVRFEEHEAGTEVVVEHERIADAAAAEQHEQGWVGCLDGLAELMLDG